MVNMTAYHTDHLNTSAKIVKCQMSLEDSEASIRAGYTVNNNYNFFPSFFKMIRVIFFGRQLSERFYSVPHFTARLRQYSILAILLTDSGQSVWLLVRYIL